MSSVEQSKKTTRPKKSFKEMSWRSRFKVVRYCIVTHPLEIMFGILILLAAILFLNPFPALDLYIDNLPFGIGGFANNVGQWIAYEGGASLSGGVFIVVAVAIVGIRVRQYTLSKKHLWSNVCPSCSENFTLKRIRRSKQDRLLNLLQVPVRRYRCKNCQWTGRRIDEDQI